MEKFGCGLTFVVAEKSSPPLRSWVPPSNRLLGQSYDPNGNITSMGTFDVENRLTVSGQDTYDYGIDNKRIYKKTTGTNALEEVYFYAGGKKIADRKWSLQHVRQRYICPPT